mmetsp:Transcript_26802/g.73876  ORF Transcript_26802/g.73876 Transcript_26802/m.73876 type:complete len:114 (+) Transcript_26802:2680-3021(+)
MITIELLIAKPFLLCPDSSFYPDRLLQFRYEICAVVVTFSPIWLMMRGYKLLILALLFFVVDLNHVIQNAASILSHVDICISIHSPVFRPLVTDNPVSVALLIVAASASTSTL